MVGERVAEVEGKGVNGDGNCSGMCRGGSTTRITCEKCMENAKNLLKCCFINPRRACAGGLR